MTLVGFRAQNHRQQVSKLGARPEVDNLETPWEFFTPLSERFGGFTLDEVMAYLKEPTHLGGEPKVMSGVVTICAVKP